MVTSNVICRIIYSVNRKCLKIDQLFKMIISVHESRRAVTQACLTVLNAFLTLTVKT